MHSQGMDPVGNERSDNKQGPVYTCILISNWEQFGEWPLEVPQTDSVLEKISSPRESKVSKTHWSTLKLSRRHDWCYNSKCASIRTFQGKKQTLGHLENWIACQGIRESILIECTNIDPESHWFMIQHDGTCIIQCFFVDFQHSSIAWIPTLRGSRDFPPWDLPELQSEKMWKGCIGNVIQRSRRISSV